MASSALVSLTVLPVLLSVADPAFIKRPLPPDRTQVTHRRYPHEENLASAAAALALAVLVAAPRTPEEIARAARERIQADTRVHPGPHGHHRQVRREDRAPAGPVFRHRGRGGRRR
ncbi:MAG: hypothetical protein M0C28_48550 [Candidatus Moduliflexus flocculans]|nr:hypothetical protein [Candidatus Moduliflexus flocculans]